MCEYNGYKYDLLDLIIYHYDSNLPEYKTGKVYNINTKEEFDISDALILYNDKIKNILDKSGEFASPTQQSKIHKIFTDKLHDVTIAQLKNKLDNDTITLEDIQLWRKLMSYKERNNFAIAEYSNFVIINASKTKPKELNLADYGRFFHLLHLMNYQNVLRFSNGKPMTKETLARELGFDEPNSVDRFLRKLKKFNMIVKTEPNNDGVSFIIVNPLYAMRSVEIDHTTYIYFQKDLDEILSPLERKYIQLKKNPTPSLSFTNNV